MLESYSSYSPSFSLTYREHQSITRFPYFAPTNHTYRSLLSPFLKNSKLFFLEPTRTTTATTTSHHRSEHTPSPPHNTFRRTLQPTEESDAAGILSGSQHFVSVYLLSIYSFLSEPFRMWINGYSGWVFCMGLF
uniref:Uncharacterized protein n=1 Tax=Helianthus annuus TaxID=4232 RepID=A0A251SVP3_HELAN